MKKLTVSEKALIIQLLEQRRIYFEGKNNKLAKEASQLILKIHD
tara:strand:- start:266 stop:397 length:132 start_codon:yes stop_codon:yes gene_type:complete